jgi:hypothetical protein
MLAQFFVIRLGKTTALGSEVEPHFRFCSFDDLPVVSLILSNAFVARHSWQISLPLAKN